MSARTVGAYVSETMTGTVADLGTLGVRLRGRSALPLVAAFRSMVIEWDTRVYVGRVQSKKFGHVKAFAFTVGQSV